MRIRSKFAVGIAVLSLPVAGALAQEGWTGPLDGTTFFSGAENDMTPGRPARGPARSVGGGRLSRGFVDWGGPARELPNTAKGSTGAEPTAKDAFQLNFVNVELQEFVRAVFDEILKENVIVDPALTGRVSVRTTNPVPRDTALNLVREALQSAGATLARPGGVWRVGAAPRGSGTAREMVRLLPVRYISLAEVRQAIQPFAAGNSAEILASATGRYLILAGQSSEVERLVRIVETVDVDELRGRAFALVPLRNAQAFSVTQDLARMIGQDGLSQRVKIFPVERMNAVMVTSADPEVINRARRWIEGLDQSGMDRRQVYIFPIRNRRAVELVKVLDGMTQGRGRFEGGNETPTVAPGLTPQTGSMFGGNSRSASVGGGMMAGNSQQQPVTFERTGEDSNLQSSPRSSSSSRDAQQGVEVRADSATNSLVVVANPEDHRIISSAIRSLDVLPTQVLIEATIAEVRLTNELKHGVRWYFQAGKHGIGLGGGAPLTGIESRSGAPGLTYSFGVPNAKVAISALESVTNVEVISSPALTVLDNQSATLKVGDQVPIATRSSRSVISPDSPLVNDIEMKDTGIILQVTPRVNTGGLVMLDIKQEASDVVPTTTSNLNSPTIRMRQVTSTVAVKSGAEIVLGGIIQKGRVKINEGVPFLKDIPILGTAFTSNGENSTERTELIIIIRPTIMANPREVRAVTEQIKTRRRAPAKPAPAPKAVPPPKPAISVRY